MRIRLRKTELIVIALTLMFTCFVGGFFTGRKAAVSVVAVAPPQSSSSNVALTDVKPDAGSTDLRDGETSDNNAAGKDSAAPSSEANGDSSDSSFDAGEASDADADANAAGEEQQQQQPSPGALRDSDGKININTASKTELTDLSGIGPALAGRIVDYREKNGSYKKIDDIMKVSGIGQKKFEAIMDRITVG